MMATLVFGAMGGLGLWLGLLAVADRPPPLDVALDRLRKTPGKGAASRGNRQTSHVTLIGEWQDSAANIGLSHLGRDLAMLDRDRHTHLAQRAMTAAFYGGLPLGFWLVTVLAGDSLFSLATAVLAAGAGSVGGWVVTDWQVRVQAERRRREFDGVLATYLQLVSILLTGGAGVHQALNDAAETGQGWVFELVRSVLRDARLRAASPWEVLGEWGERYGLSSLEELAATMTLAGSSGARVRTSLLHKATTLRARELAAIEREATNRTTAMVGPTGLMMAGFVVLVIYPAFVAVLNL